jgi:hypothetical protein
MDIVERLRNYDHDFDGTIPTLKEAANEIEQSRKEIAALRKALAADNQTLRLYLGEMTQQEMRTLKAGFNWVLAQARQ